MADPIQVFLDNLIPPAPDRSEVAERRGKIATALDADKLKAGYLIESGSFSHGTGIKAKSDVDYLAWHRMPGRSCRARRCDESRMR